MVIDYYFSVLSDWAYFGGERLEQLARRYGVGINHMPMRLAAVYAGTGGIILQKRSKQRQDYRVVELVRWRDYLGIPIELFPKHYPTDDQLSSCMIIAAKLRGFRPARECRSQGDLGGEPRHRRSGHAAKIGRRARNGR
jgi:2-hydroxychromene-2-carboxylate isomerase